MSGTGRAMFREKLYTTLLWSAVPIAGAMLADYAITILLLHAWAAYTPLVTLSIATSESWKDDRSGERRERTEWHRVVIFNEGLGKIAERYLEKGAKVYLEGKLTTRKWQDQSGADRYSTEIHLTPYNGVLTFLDSKREGERPAGGEPAGSTGPDGDPDEEIPF